MTSLGETGRGTEEADRRALAGKSAADCVADAFLRVGRLCSTGQRLAILVFGRHVAGGRRIIRALLHERRQRRAGQRLAVLVDGLGLAGVGGVRGGCCQDQDSGDQDFLHGGSFDRMASISCREWLSGDSRCWSAVRESVWRRLNRDNDSTCPQRAYEVGFRRKGGQVNKKAMARPCQAGSSRSRPRHGLKVELKDVAVVDKIQFSIVPDGTSSI